MTHRRSVVCVVTVLLLCLRVSHSLIPAGFSTFFRGSSCPPGWIETPESKGRIIVSVSHGSQSGLTVGTPLEDMEDRTHAHTLSSTLYLDLKSVSAIGCCNPLGACYGEYPVNGKAAMEASGLPFVQLLLCTIQANTSGDIPYGTIGYFSGTAMSQCEDLTGWATLATATGRAIIPGYSSGVISSLSLPLSNQEDRNHSHAFQCSFQTEDQSYAGIAGCCDDKLAQNQLYQVEDVTQPSSSGVPYVQLLTCICQVPTFNFNLPSDAYIFTEVSCPPGYRISEVLAGRYLVSLPVNGTTGAIFGGPSIPAGERAGNTHTHPFNTWFTTKSCEIGLASGCCGDGYVRDNEYVTEGITADGDVSFPFFSVPFCEPDPSSWDALSFH